MRQLLLRRSIDDALARADQVVRRLAHALPQDVYGEHVFPLQVSILLSDPERDFTSGGFVLTEQRPRRQSRVQVVPLRRGDGVVFAVRNRPVQGTRGYRVNLRHGVSPLRSGHRYTLGVIFHDAK